MMMQEETLEHQVTALSTENRRLREKLTESEEDNARLRKQLDELLPVHVGFSQSDRPEARLNERDSKPPDTSMLTPKSSESPPPFSVRPKKRARVLMDAVEITRPSKSPRKRPSRRRSSPLQITLSDTDRDDSPAPRDSPTGVDQDSAANHRERSAGAVVKEEVDEGPQTREEIDAFMARLHPPDIKVKVKDEAPRLNNDSVEARLALINFSTFPVTLEEEIRDVVVTRTFMSKQYGGSSQRTFPPISAERVADHSLNDFMYLNLDCNPHAPMRPGYPGLFFDLGSSEGSNWDTIQRVFVKSVVNIWQYLGQYKMSPAPSLTAEEFKMQREKVKSTWSKMILVSEGGKSTRIAIILRRQLGREPEEQEIEQALATQDNYMNLTEEEIVQAFERGEETIAVWCMKCVGYDEVFQRSLAERFPTWVPPPPNQKKDGPKGSTKKKLKPRQQVAGPKRKRVKKEDESDGEYESDGKGNGGEEWHEEGEEDELDENIAVDMMQGQHFSRGTRSRPLAIKMG